MEVVVNNTNHTNSNSTAHDALFGEAWDIMLAYTSSLAVKSVIELGVLDIIDNKGDGEQLVSVAEIAEKLAAKADSKAGVNMAFLYRLLRFLASCKFLSCVTPSHGSWEQTLYGLTPTSRCFTTSNPENLNGFLLHLLHPIFIDTFHNVPLCVLDKAKDPFILTHGKDEWEFLSGNPSLREHFNVSQASVTTGSLHRVLDFYKGYADIQSIVDVGGASGQALSQILAMHPHLHAINFDLPHVIANVTKLPGIQFVGGNMFESIPQADAIHFKTVLHDWDDEHVVKALKNCYKATPMNGRVIICDLVISNDQMIDSPVQQRKLAHDMVMLTHRGIGYERTSKEWKNLINKAGFMRVNFYGLDLVVSLIEAFKV